MAVHRKDEFISMTRDERYVLVRDAIVFGLVAGFGLAAIIALLIAWIVGT